MDSQEIGALYTQIDSNGFHLLIKQAKRKCPLEA